MIEMAYQIFDAHAHIGKDLFCEISAEELVDGMRKWNIKKALVSIDRSFTTASDL